MKKFSKTLVIFIFLAAVVGAGYWYLNRKENSTEEDTDQTTESSTDNETEDEEEDIYDTYIDVTPEEAKDLIENEEDLVILDVSNSYDNGHLPGAINYYVGDASFEESLLTLDPTVPHLVYCHVDSASIAGAETLIDAGFVEVYRLEGNYSAWVDAGYDIEY